MNVSLLAAACRPPERSRPDRLRVDAVERLVCDAGADFQQMVRPERRERIGRQPLDAAARAILIVEVAAGVDVRREHHRPAAHAGIDRRIELFHADARFEHAAAADDDLVGRIAEHVVVRDVRVSRPAD